MSKRKDVTEPFATVQRARDIAQALRCSNTPGCPDCHEGCPYRIEEEIDPTWTIRDFVRDGKAYVIHCDFEQMNIDAADMLEVLAGG